MAHSSSNKSCFHQQADLPQWLEACRLDGAYQAQAYEATPDAWRARLKTAIAFQFELWGEAPALERRHRQSPAKGFASCVQDGPAAWTLAVLDHTHASPARMLAALMPAILAGVERIILVSVDGTPSAGHCLALELAGLEDVYVLPVNNRPAVSDLLVEICTHHASHGRLLLFPAATAEPKKEFSDLANAARKLGVRCWQDVPAPIIGIFNSSDTETRQIINWAHGDACVTEYSSADVITARTDACFFSHDITSEPAFAPSCACPMLFGSGLDACWRFQDLDRDFFRVFSLSASLIS